jgi:hypothetical protein
MDPETAWEELTAAALLGTERRPFTPPIVLEPLASMLSGLSGREPEKALLGTASALSLFRRAGRRPIQVESNGLEPAAIDERPRSSTTSDSHLALMLAGIHADVLPEWLDILNEVGKRPADETWPDLLDLGRSRVEIRPKIVAAASSLGVWLARQNPDWTYASGADLAAIKPDDPTIETRWQTDTTEERAALLRLSRRSHPAQARELVASTWTTDRAEIRATFLETFEIGLTLDDEPFLEAALDDRRKEVRSAASDLLRRLPGSALVARMVARIAPLLKIVATDPGTIAIDVSLPETRDKAMIRDGVDSKFSELLGLGEKANWLYQMVACVPPSHWSRAWGRSPAELAGPIVRSEWGDALYPALIEAAILHGDSEWNDALSAQSLPWDTKANLLKQIQAQSPSRREAMVLSMIRNLDSSQKIGTNTSVFMDQIPAPWGDELSRLALERSVMFTTIGNRDYLAARLGKIGLRVATTVALATPPNLAFPMANPPAYLIEQVNSHFAEYQALIQFRHEMNQELRR